jgi:putative peptidoglycan lipid II flippase
VYGAAGLTATAGVAGWIEFLLLRGALLKRIGRFVVGARTLAVAWGSALLAGAAAFGLHRLLPANHPVMTGTVVLSVFGVLYLLGTVVGGLDEARALLRRIRR